MFGNLKFIWKFSILAVAIPLTAVIIAVIGLIGAGMLKAQFDNLYGFMLIPVYNVQEADLHLKNISIDLSALNDAGLSGAQRSALVDTVGKEDQQMSAIMSRYDNEWLSTTSPDFTAALASMGKSALQTDEANALKQYHDAYTLYALERDTALSGRSSNPPKLSSIVSEMDKSISNLSNINMQFANLSNAWAQEAITQMRWQIILAGILLSVLGSVFAILLTRSVIGPLSVITSTMKDLSTGDLNRDLSEKTQVKLGKMKDEVGEVARGMTATRLYLTDMAEAAARIAAGDLTVNVTPKSEKDELGKSFSKMVDSLRLSVGKIADNADALGAAARQLASAAHQAGQATTQIATTIQQVAGGNMQLTQSVSQTAVSGEQMGRAIDGVARGARGQAASINKASAITAQISQSVDGVAGNAQVVTHNSAEAARAAKDGVKTVNETIQGMESIKSKVSLSAAKVQEMGARSDQIGVIVETIDDIASQTNLLALNAAIEAARAGEHGKGFAVVADEVRKLAERASSATKEIGALIRGIQGTVNEAVAAMKESAQEVESGVLMANNAGQALESISKAAESVYQHASQTGMAADQMKTAVSELAEVVKSVSVVVEENTVATEQMSTSSREVTHAIENIASVSEENSASVEEVSAGAEEMSAQVEEVSASARLLETMAQALEDVVAQFKLTDEPISHKVEVLPALSAAQKVANCPYAIDKI